MVDPLSAAATLTASKIAELAFQKFLESGAGELGKKFTTDAIAQRNSRCLPPGTPTTPCKDWLQSPWLVSWLPVGTGQLLLG